MSNLQPSSRASVADMWLYALHDKYFPASERLNVIDNVLVVWLPSLDVCQGEEKKKSENILIRKLKFCTEPGSVRSQNEKAKKKEAETSQAQQKLHRTHVRIGFFIIHLRK